MTNLNAARANTRQTKLKSFKLSNIIPIAALIGQCDRHEKLTKAIQRWDLTESLEILSEYGFDGDLSILVISESQNSLMRRVAK